MLICVVAKSFCLEVPFTSGGGKCLHTTGLCFVCLVTMSSSVLCRELRELMFHIVRWVYLSACRWSGCWTLPLFRCNIFLMCPSFCLCWLCGRCPLYLPLGWMHVCFLRGVGRISTCCSHTWNLLSVLGIRFCRFNRSVLCTSFYSRGRLVGICHSCRIYFGQSLVSLTGVFQ